MTENTPESEQGDDTPPDPGNEAPGRADTPVTAAEIVAGPEATEPEPAWNPLPPEPLAQDPPPSVSLERPADPFASKPPAIEAVLPPVDPGPELSDLSDPGEFAPLFSRVDQPSARLVPSLPADEAIARAGGATPRSRWQAIGVPILAGLLGAGIALTAFLILDDDPVPTNRVAGAEPVVIREQVRTEFVPVEGTGEIEADPAAVARKVIPSIIHVQIGTGSAGNFAVAGSGSGVVLSEDGLIVTNNHVVEGASDVQVIFADGRTYQAEILGTDPRTDLAVLKIDAAGLIPIEIGSAEDLVIGDPAIAAGNPLGLEGGPSLTVGVISAFGRQVTTGPGVNDRLFGMIQTDAPITRGSSGGALVDRQGRLIGITSAVGVSDVGVEGIGFAIPVERMRRITDEIIINGSVTHSFLGIEGSTFFADQADGSQVPTGIDIQSFLDDSAAEAAGLQEGDVITKLNGRTLTTMEALVAELLEHPVGETITVVVDREGAPVTVDVLLGERPQDLDQ